MKLKKKCIYTTLPVHNNIILVGESSEKDGKKI
jgi:hypothetical protein